MSVNEKRFLRRAQVERVTGYSASTLYRKAKRGDFPRPVKLGERASGWLQAEVDAWMDERISASRGDAA